MINMVTCHVCGNSENNFEYKVKEMMFGFRDEFIYFECSQCGCLQIAKIPSNISKYYSSNYYSYENPETRIYINLAKGRILRSLLFGSTFVDILFQNTLSIFPDKAVQFRANALNASAILKFPLMRDSKVLDVGCGSGLLLYILKNLGFPNVMGCDPYIDHDIVYRNGLQILKEHVENIAGRWDLIMFNHSFEHIQYQLETLKSVKKMLRKNGVCLINMPITSSYAWKHYKTNWVSVDAPRHFYLHSVKSMRLLAKLASFNLRNIIYTSSAFQFWGSEQYARDIPLTSSNSYVKNREKCIFSERQIGAYARKAIELNKKNQGDSAAFYLSQG